MQAQIKYFDYIEQASKYISCIMTGIEVNGKVRSYESYDDVRLNVEKRLRDVCFAIAEKFSRIDSCSRTYTGEKTFAYESDVSRPSPVCEVFSESKLLIWRWPCITESKLGTPSPHEVIEIQARLMALNTKISELKIVKCNTECANSLQKALDEYIKIIRKDYMAAKRAAQYLKLPTDISSEIKIEEYELERITVLQEFIGLLTRGPHARQHVGSITTLSFQKSIVDTITSEEYKPSVQTGLPCSSTRRKRDKCLAM